MKQGWEIKKLGEICTIQLGKTPYRKNSKFWDKEKISGNVWLSIADLKHGEYISDSTEQVTDIGAKDIVKIPKGTILLSFKLTLGRVSFAGIDLYTNEAIASLLNLDKKISKDFLFYYFNLFDWDKAAEGDIKVKGKTLNKQKLKELPIIVPPLPEQQRIVSILDEAFAAIAKAKANAEQNLKNAKELFESYLQGVFENKGDGWEEKTLGQLCVFTQGIQRDVKLQSEIQGENQVRFLRIVDYTQGNDPPRFIDFPGEKYILNTDDVALVRYGASTGFVCRGLEGALANNLFRVIPKSLEKLTNDFLFIFLQSPIFQNVIKATMNGAAMPAISFGLIEEIPFPLPPLKTQQTIVRQLDALRAETQKLEAVYQKKIADLEELKKSLLQKAFAGELRNPEGAEYDSEAASPLAYKKHKTISSPEGA